MLVIAAILTMAVYLFRGAVVISGKYFSADPFMKRHLGILVSLFLLSSLSALSSTAFGLLTDRA